jgi:hypothetical protein
LALLLLIALFPCLPLRGSISPKAFGRHRLYRQAVEVVETVPIKIGRQL